MATGDTGLPQKCSMRVAVDFRVWGSLAQAHAPGTNKFSLRTRACVFLGFPLDASSWVFYDPVTCGFFASHDVNPPSRPGSPPPPLRVLPRQGEGTGAAGAGGVGYRGAGGVAVEVTPIEDTSASIQQPCPASTPGFPSVLQFPPCSSLRPVAAEPSGVLVGGTESPGGVGGGGAGSGGAGAGGTCTVAPTPHTVRFLTCEQRLLRLEREELAVGESRGGVTTAAAGAVAAAAGHSRGGVTSSAAGVVAVAAGESRGVTAALREGRAGFPPAAAGAVTDTAGESRGGVTATAGEGSAGVPPAAAGATAAAGGKGRGVTGAAIGAGTIAAHAKGGRAAATATARLAQSSTCTLGSWSLIVPSDSACPVPFLILVDSLFSPQSCCVSRTL
ncbi:unnamed protein product, partial [Closterium sp. NIES-53]